MDEEIRKKLQAVRSVEDVIAIGKECGRELTDEKAREIYDQLKLDAATGELSDSDLEAVAGGDSKDKLKTKIKAMFVCHNCHNPDKPTRDYLVKTGCVYDRVLYCDDCARLFGLLP